MVQNLQTLVDKLFEWKINKSKQQKIFILHDPTLLTEIGLMPNLLYKTSV